MADQEKDRQMDEMLDSLLATYSSAEPRPGLETRILANLRDEEGRETPPAVWRFRWLWAGSAVAVAIIVAAVLIGGRHHIVPPTKTNVQSSQPAPRQPETLRLPVPAAAIQERHHRKTSILARPRNVASQNVNLALSARPSVFPTPTPLSEQEQLLLRYLARTPREEVIAQSHPDEPPAGEADQSQAIPDLTHIPQKLSNTR